MKKSIHIRQITEPIKNYPTHRSTDESKLQNSQAKIKAFVHSYDNFGDFSFDNLGDTLATCFSFFRKISVRNQQFYKSLLQQVKVKKYNKGQVLTLINEPAQTAIFILQGRAGVYVKGGMSPQRAKGYKQQYGQQFHLEIMNTVSKRKSNIIQQQNAVLDLIQRRQKQHNKLFTSQDEIKQWFPNLFKSSEISDLDTIDQSTLKRPVIRAATIIAESPMVIAVIDKNQFKQKTWKYDNIAVQTDEKLQILRNFGIFKSWDTKLNSLAMYFQKKKYKKGDILYTQGDIAHGFYLIISGEIQFSFKRQNKPKPKEIDEEQQDQRKKTIDIFKIDLEILDKGSYFGQVELLKKTVRKCTAECRSASAQIYFLNKKNFFFIGYETDLFYVLKLKLPLRQKHRDRQQQNAMKIKSLSKVVKKQPDVDIDYSLIVPSQNNNKYSKLQNNNPSSIKNKFYHGYIVPDMSNIQPTKAPFFSMLKSNNEMYKQTQKKFRRFIKQPKVQKKPEVNWNMKRVWKVLNLDDVLEDESQLAQNKQGLQYFYKNQRLQSQINQSKSLRPRTSSCSYQDKLKYIRYLDNFDKSFNSRRFSKV